MDGGDRLPLSRRDRSLNRAGIGAGSGTGHRGAGNAAARTVLLRFVYDLFNRRDLLPAIQSFQVNQL